MKSRAVNTSSEQDAYRSSILKRKPREPVDQKSVVTATLNMYEYMDNCMYWINEYKKKRTIKERMKLAAGHLKRYCIQLEAL